MSSIYSAGIVRVSKKATALGIKLPHDVWEKPQRLKNESNVFPGTEFYETRLGDTLMDHLDDINIRYVFRLMQAESNPFDWHYIEFSDSHELDVWDDIQCARSMKSAIEYLYRKAEDVPATLRREHGDDGAIYFFHEEEKIATIAPMVFKESNEKIALKAKSILKHVTSIHHEGCLHRMFSPLLANYSERPECTIEHNYEENSNYVIYTTLNNLAHSIKRAFARLDIEISLGHSQELLAAFFDFPSWNHLRAVEVRCKNISLNPSVVIQRNRGKSHYSFFKDDSQAIAYYSLLMDKGAEYKISVTSTFGSLTFRQPMSSISTSSDSFMDENALILKTLHQCDLYELDQLIPMNGASALHLG